MVYLIEMSCRLLFVRRVDVTADRGQRGGLGLGCCGTARAAAQADRPTYKLCPGGVSCRVGLSHATVVSLTHGRRRQSGKVARSPTQRLPAYQAVRPPVPQPGRSASVVESTETPWLRHRPSRWIDCTSQRQHSGLESS